MTVAAVEDFALVQYDRLAKPVLPNVLHEASKRLALDKREQLRERVVLVRHPLAHEPRHFIVDPLCCLAQRLRQFGAPYITTARKARFAQRAPLQHVTMNVVNAQDSGLGLERVPTGVATVRSATRSRRSAAKARLLVGERSSAKSLILSAAQDHDFVTGGLQFCFELGQLRSQWENASPSCWHGA